ncbi:CDP-glycerol glycerophosphotransferase family protein [Listeria seeligeri]|uniref:CDP-glycerol glycerophosphotransferase family protein n=1 Tax=Listeria seeligeri TaxID=1640 RepID=UPI001626690C|nr:CDP-glycerol glycerophosphotransferase family protein [Listeria seeligeri]MBC1581366.1 glycosyl transferase family 2 [Listeria seeligeri]MBC1595574.1 glycosyl transferase family 2 [Listeria seeligeri]MBC2219584.1 glycosyl transferase family 2 [Listeria seeligeri]MBF2414387.1 CDP-glycerol glycerophosphotransferase family protein [Listeria seeligeri]MBF2447344.1 CDP-glycerol glycerophosphotransferase family protein [Listeria seeligeri]
MSYNCFFISLCGLFVYNKKVINLLYEQKEPDILNDSQSLQSICFVTTEVESGEKKQLDNLTIHYVAETADFLTDCLALLEKENKQYISFISEQMKVEDLLEKIATCSPDIVCLNKLSNGSLYTNPECLNNELSGSAFSKNLLKRVAQEMKQEAFELIRFNYYSYHLAETIVHLDVPKNHSQTLLELTNTVSNLLEVKDNHYRKEWTILFYVNKFLMLSLESLPEVFQDADENYQRNYLEQLTTLLKKLPDDVFFEMDALDYLVKNILIDAFEVISYEAYPSCLTLVEVLSNRAAPNKFTSPEWERIQKCASKGSIRPLASQKTPTILTPIKKKFVSYFSRKVVFTIAKWLPVAKNNVMLVSNKISNLDATFMPIYQTIKEQHPEKNVRAYMKMKPEDNHAMYYLTYFWNLGRAKYVFLDDYYYQLYSIRMRKEAEVIQLWHAAGAFKRFGHSSLGFKDSISLDFETRAHQNYTTSIISASDLKPIYAEAFHMDETKIEAFGLPRLWKLFDQDYKEFRKDYFQKMYPLLKGKKVITYAPTFRGNSEERKEFHLELNLRKMRAELGNDYLVVIKLHPLVSIETQIPEDLADFVLDFSGIEMNDVLITTDILITDYSSVIYDFSILNRPILFYAYDLDAYALERNFYQDYLEFVPGPVVATTDEAIQLIKTNRIVTDKLLDFAEKAFEYHDGNAAKRIIKHVMED